MEATNYLHILAVWLGCAPRTSCARRIDDEILARLRRIQSQGSISFCDDPIRSDPTLFASEVNFSSSTIEVIPQGTTKLSQPRDPDTRRAGPLEPRCSAASMSRHPYPGRSNVGHGSPMPRRVHPPLVLAAAIALIRRGMLAPRALVRARPSPTILDFLPCH